MSEGQKEQKGNAPKATHHRSPSVFNSETPKLCCYQDCYPSSGRLGGYSWVQDDLNLGERWDEIQDRHRLGMTQKSEPTKVGVDSMSFTDALIRL